MAHVYALPASLRDVWNILTELDMVYGFMIQNAPTEESRRLVEINRMTVRNTKAIVGAVYMEITGQPIPATWETIMELPVFTNFMDAGRYAFLREITLINMFKELHMIADTCFHMRLFGLIVDHELNAMRLLYLIG